MKPHDFRKIMMEQIRGFENWAWKDQLDNPESWKEEMTFQKWMTLFTEYLEA